MKWEQQSQSYRRGFIEGIDDRGERNCLGIQDGVADTSEYERGYADGQAERKEHREPVK